MDERNFHCWNYRFWVLDTLLNEVEERLRNPEKEIDHSEVWTKYQAPLVQQECDMALAMIKKNFSNYSAWHYRAKLLPKFHDVNGHSYNRGYIIPVEDMKEDLATLKHAFFTDPKDQSPWNQHEWLLLQIAPTQVVHIQLADQT